MKRKTLTLILALTFILSLGTGVLAADDTALDEAVANTASYLYESISAPQVGSVGGEWSVLGLARSGCDVPRVYFEDYYKAVVTYTEACAGEFHKKKYTEYSRVVLALTAIGRDPSDVGGYNLLKPLGDFDKVVWQGINGPVFALLALDSGDYAIPKNTGAETQATRERYVDYILDLQLEDGGWALYGTASDTDITAMALQALAKYTARDAVASAVERALTYLSEEQNEDGGYASWGSTNSESVAQAVTALCELGISLEDARFVKNGITLLDNLMTFYVKDGGFRHIGNRGDSNQMATEQAFYALVAAQRVGEGNPSLYRMSDVVANDTSVSEEHGVGLPGKHVAVKSVPVVNPGVDFEDVSGKNAHENQAAIDALAARGIISGMGDGTFVPDATMTREQFAAIIVRGLGLRPAGTGIFEDIAEGAWSEAYIATAYSYGIVNGIGNNRFNPGGTITRQEAAAMMARAASLCGMNTAYTTSRARDILAPFGDYVQAETWARAPLAFCYDSGIMDDTALNIAPASNILRCDVAQMLYNLLSAANLL